MVQDANPKDFSAPTTPRDKQAGQMHRSIWDASATTNIWSTEKRKDTGAFVSNQVRQIRILCMRMRE